MPHARPQELPAGSRDRWPICSSGFASVQWGDLEIGYTTVDEPSDYTDLYKLAGLPGAVCPCPHYGFIFSGTIRCRFPDTDRPDEVATAGEVYFFPAGHVLIYEEATEALELNPAFALQQLMNSLEATVQRMSNVDGAS